MLAKQLDTKYNFPIILFKILGIFFMIEFIENIFLNPFAVENLLFISSILGFLFFILFKNVISSGLLTLLQLFFF